MVRDYSSLFVVKLSPHLIVLEHKQSIPYP
ncbi:hypothetical protein GA0116948_11043 [Chitinophaga costaii]|uniref:Uncharacterized protein n=1 Tax=Chitinophaga costaii TaxID=1335309 RepID=A0A1C4EW37_9BACT|nr:hypothetical protein GA0116948_11043 [Chitinophaga costaii]